MNSFNLLRSCSRSTALRASRLPTSSPSPLALRYNTRIVARSASSSTEASSDKTGARETDAKSTEGANGNSAQVDPLKVKDEEIADLTSRLRYAQADYINLQKISAREKEQTRDFAITNFARDLLTTVDVLQLALDSVPAAARTDKASNPKLVELCTGVDLTYKQLLQTLNKYGVQQVNPTGEEFDPNQHEALYSAPAPPGKKPGTVIDCQKLGYKIKDRTLRAAQVGVAIENA